MMSKAGQRARRILVAAHCLVLAGCAPSLQAGSMAQAGKAPAAAGSQVTPDPIWQQFNTEPPTDNVVQTWSQAQRDVSFRMLDDLPGNIFGSNPIAGGQNATRLERGPELGIARQIDAYLARNNHAGIVILHKGKIRYEGYGLKLRPEQKWTSFSVAKSFTSILVGAAIKDGYIKSVDQKVTDFVPELTGSAYDGVTIQHLLTMSTGVAWNEDYADPKSDIRQYRTHVHADGTIQAVSYLKGQKRTHPAGTFWNYSTAETELLGIVVSRAIGRPLATYLSEKVWLPYGMEADGSWLKKDDGSEMAGCCIQARMRDFARFGQFVLEGAKAGGADVVPADWMKESLTGRFKIESFPGMSYGYLWSVFADGSFGHFGIFGQAMIIDPKRELVIVSNGSWADALGIPSGQFMEREKFHADVKAAIDQEK
jgi:CubicO group peptidase (beta-lactamase class C family)